MLAELSKTTRRAPVANAVARSATLVLVAVLANGPDGRTLAVGAEGTSNALSRLGASGTVALRTVGDAALVDAVTAKTTRVLVARGTVPLDKLAGTTVAVRATDTLSIAVAVRVVGTRTGLGDTPALSTCSRCAVCGPAAPSTGGSSGGRYDSRGRRGNGSAFIILTTRVVVEGRGRVLEGLMVDKVTRNGLSHLEGHKGGGGDEESSTDRGTHLER